MQRWACPETARRSGQVGQDFAQEEHDLVSLVQNIAAGNPIFSLQFVSAVRGVTVTLRRMQFFGNPIGRQFAVLTPVLCLMLSSVSAAPQAAPSEQSEIHPPQIGIIDFYGLRAIPLAQAREALRIKEGDTIPASQESFEKFQHDAQQRLQSLAGVEAARLLFVCCDADKTILYVGVQEKGAEALMFRTAPRGKVRLPQDIVKAGDDFQQAFTKATEARDFAEDVSEGYALDHYSAVKAVQEHFVILAAKHLNILRDVLSNSADAGQRALSAQVIAYSTDRHVVVRELAAAAHDPDAGVRNNATRALGILAGYAQRHPELHISISGAPFVDMLNSLDWTDRNKSLLVLFSLTENRDPALLSLLRESALASLIEMARWKAHGHAFGACIILGRIGSMPEDKIDSQCENDNREPVISAALKSSKTH